MTGVEKVSSLSNNDKILKKQNSLDPEIRSCEKFI